MTSAKNSVTTKGKESCPLYRKCSGCDLMHEAYPRQLAIKKKWLGEAVTSFGGDAERVAFVPSPEPFGYRSSVKLCLHERKPEPRKIGLYEMRSKNVIAIGACPVQDPLINKFIAQTFPLGQPALPFYDHSRAGFQAGALKFITVRLTPDGKAMGLIVSHTGVNHEAMRQWLTNVRLAAGVSVYACLLTRADGDRVIGNNVIHLMGPKTLPFRIGDAEFALPPTAFFQANRLLLETFVGEVVRMPSAKGSGTLLDLYGGAGAYAAQLTKTFEKIYVVDGNADAIAGGRHYFSGTDAKDRVVMQASYVENFLEGLPANERKSVGWVISNPPRGGMSPTVVELLLSQHLPKLRGLTFVSCSLDNLMKNLQQLQRKRPFIVEQVTGFDMFPQTEHIETIAHLTFKG